MKQKHIVITIHGIRWTPMGDWQKDLATYIKKRDYEVNVLNYRYGHIWGVFSWLMNFGWMRKRYVNKFKKFVEKTQKNWPNAEISIVAHSFGGWLTEQMINDCDVNFGRIVFVHCPISSYLERSNFWNLMAFGRIRKIHAWSSHKDVVIGKLAIKPFGQNGYYGFMNMGAESERKHPKHKPYAIEIYNHHTSEDHGGVLNKIDQYGDVLYKQLVDINDV